MRQRPAYDLAVDDAREQTVVGVLLLLLERVHEVLVDRMARGLPLLLGFPRRVALRADRVVAPLEEVGQIALRQADEREEDRRRQWRREVLVELALALVREVVDDSVDELPRFGLERGH